MTPAHHYRHHGPEEEDDDSTQELPPVITEKARVSLPLSVLLPCIITLAGALVWATTFYLGQIETQQHVVRLEAAQVETTTQLNKLESAIAGVRYEQTRQGAKIEDELRRINALLGTTANNSKSLSKSTPVFNFLTDQESTVK